MAVLLTLRRETAMSYQTTEPRRLKAEGQSDAAWLAVLCLSRVGFVFIFTTYSAALPLLKTDWSMSASEAGLVQSAWHAGYLISLFAVGFITDRRGAKKTFLAGGILASISALLFAFYADSFLSGLLLYGFTGLCSGASYTPGLTLIAERFTTYQRGRAMGWFLAAASLGYGASLLLSGFLMPSIGWRGAFIATACGPLVATAVSFWTLRGTPNVVHPREAEAGRRLRPAAGVAQQTGHAADLGIRIPRMGTPGHVGVAARLPRGCGHAGRLHDDAGRRLRSAFHRDHLHHQHGRQYLRRRAVGSLGTYQGHSLGGSR